MSAADLLRRSIAVFPRATNSLRTRRRAAAATTADSMNWVSNSPSLKTASTLARTSGSTRMGENVAERIRSFHSKRAATWFHPLARLGVCTGSGNQTAALLPPRALPGPIRLHVHLVRPPHTRLSLKNRNQSALAMTAGCLNLPGDPSRLSAPVRFGYGVLRSRWPPDEAGVLSSFLWQARGVPAGSGPKARFAPRCGRGCTTPANEW